MTRPTGPAIEGWLARVVAAADTAPAGWDARTVDVDGGQVKQGTAWAADRAALGARPVFLELDDGRAVLALVRRGRRGPGPTVYASRGPVTAGDPPAVVARRMAALAAWAGSIGALSVVADPALVADPGFEADLAAAGWEAVEEIQAERHRLVLRWAAGATPDDVLAGIAKATRQRIRQAERAGTTVAPATDDATLGRFAELYGATARRRAFWVGEVALRAAWWRRVLDAGQAIMLAARHDGALVGGLLLYRQGGRLASAYSADDAATRSDLPGTMHLLRWSAIRAALAAGHDLIDLGGVDLPGARRIPRPGEPTYGLYEHKRSFGAVWVECAPAHRRILRPWAHRADALLGRLRSTPPSRPAS
jgi:lipid II:glycine glycyltransferase (peptidoglycan interpeptide bridge formation enzyme)